MSGAEKRTALDDFSKEVISANELTTQFPDCGCEDADSPPNSPGPVTDDETLRYFLMSRSQIDGKKPSHRKGRKFKPNSLERIFTVGLSVCRIDHASTDEIESTAKLLYDYQVGSEPEFGGLLAVLDFPAELVRAPSEDENAISCCVYETPLDEPNEAGQFERPSHADILASRTELTPEQRKISRDLMFNRLQKNGRQLNAEQIEDCDLHQFLPKAALEDAEAESAKSEQQQD